MRGTFVDLVVLKPETLQASGSQLRSRSVEHVRPIGGHEMIKFISPMSSSFTIWLVVWNIHFIDSISVQLGIRSPTDLYFSKGLKAKPAMAFVGDNMDILRGLTAKRS